MAGDIGVRRLLIAAVLSLFLGCEQAPAPVGPAQVPVGPLTAQLKAEGDSLAARGEYAAAVVKYQAAISQEPGDPLLWFAFGTSLSHLGRREETIQAFRRVVQLGKPDSQEVQVARRWLVSAGALGELPSFASPSEGSAPSQPTATARASQGPKGALRGTTQWAGLPAEARISVMIVLSGDDSSTKGLNFSRRTWLGEPYEFTDIPSGTYRLIAASGDTRLWEQRVTVETDRQTALDLTSASSQASLELPKVVPGAGEKHGQPERVPAGQGGLPPAGVER